MSSSQRRVFNSPNLSTVWSRGLTVAITTSLLLGLANAGSVFASEPDDVSVVSATDIALALADTSQVQIPSLETVAVPDDPEVLASVSSEVLAADMPVNSIDGVDLTVAGHEIEVSLPGQPSSGSGQKLADGTVVYPSDNGAASAVVAGETSVQMMTIISEASAPAAYTYDVKLPEGGRIELSTDGGATVYDSASTPVLGVPAPWAKDAQGAVVATRFETDGRSLTQVVDHQNNTSITYPVVADPIWFAIAPAIFWWAVQRCGVGGALGAMAAYVSGDRSPWALSAQGAAGCVASFIGGWGILRNMIRLVRW